MKIQCFYQQDGIDYAYSELPLELIQKSIEPGISFEFSYYKEPFVNAVKDEAYGFAVRKNYEFVKMGDA